MEVRRLVCGVFVCLSGCPGFVASFTQASDILSEIPGNDALEGAASVPGNSSYINLLSQYHVLTRMQAEADTYLRDHGYKLKKDVFGDAVTAPVDLPATQINTSGEIFFKSESQKLLSNITPSVTSNESSHSRDPRVFVVPRETFQRVNADRINDAKRNREAFLNAHGKLPSTSHEVIRAKYAKWEEEKRTMGFHEHGFPGSLALAEWDKDHAEDVEGHSSNARGENPVNTSHQALSGHPTRNNAANSFQTFDQYKNSTAQKLKAPGHKGNLKGLKTDPDLPNRNKTRSNFFRWLQDGASQGYRNATRLSADGDTVGFWGADGMGKMAALNQRKGWVSNTISPVAMSYDSMGYPHGFDNGFDESVITRGTPAVELMLKLKSDSTYMNCEAGFWEPLHVGDAVNLIRPYALATANDLRCRENCFRLGSQYQKTSGTEFLVDSALSGCVFPIVGQHAVNVQMIQNDTQWYGVPEKNSRGGSRVFYNVFLDDVKWAKVKNVYDISQVLASFDTGCSGIDGRLLNATLMLRMGSVLNANTTHRNYQQQYDQYLSQMSQAISDTMKAEIKGASTSEAIIVDTSFWFRKWLLADHIPSVLIGVQTACPEIHHDENLWNSSIIVEEAGAWAYGIDPACHGKATCGECLGATTDQQQACTWCSLPETGQAAFYDAVGFTSVAQAGSDGRCGLGEVSCLHLGGTYATTC